MLSELFPHRICKIDAEESIEAIQNQIKTFIESLISSKTDVVED